MLHSSSVQMCGGGLKRNLNSHLASDRVACSNGWRRPFRRRERSTPKPELRHSQLQSTSVHLFQVSQSIGLQASTPPGQYGEGRQSCPACPCCSLFGERSDLVTTSNVAPEPEPWDFSRADKLIRILGTLGTASPKATRAANDKALKGSCYAGTPIQPRLSERNRWWCRNKGYATHYRTRDTEDVE